MRNGADTEKSYAGFCNLSLDSGYHGRIMTMRMHPSWHLLPGKGAAHLCPWCRDGWWRDDSSPSATPPSPPMQECCVEASPTRPRSMPRTFKNYGFVMREPFEQGYLRINSKKATKEKSKLQAGDFGLAGGYH